MEHRSRSFLPKRKLVDNQIISEEAGDDDTNIESTQKPVQYCMDKDLKEESVYFNIMYSYYEAN